MKLRLLALLLGAASLHNSTGASAAPVRAALLPIAVHSADDGSSYLSAGLAEMISARLEQSGGVSVILPQGPAVGTSDLAKAVEAGKTAGADYVVFGAFTQFGAGASLDVQCAAVNAEGEARPRRIFVQSGTLGEIIPKLDDLAAKLARFMISGNKEAQAVAAGAPSDSTELEDIRRRLDALERAVRYEAAKQPAEAAKPPAQAPGGPPAAGATR